MMNLIRNIMFLFLLISFSYDKFFLSLIQKELREKIDQKINQSTVFLGNITKDYSGSGLVIKKGQNKYVLTNAHVCNKTEEKGQEKWLIKNDSVEWFFVKNSEKYSNTSLDYCFMEYMGTVPAYDLDRKDLFYKLAEYFLPYEDSVYHYSRNRTINNVILKRKTRFDDYLKENIMALKGKNNSYDYVVKKESYKIDAKIVSGDSGSPLFNYLGELKGQVFGQQLKQHPEILFFPFWNNYRIKEEINVDYGLATKFENIEPTFNKL